MGNILPRGEVLYPTITWDGEVVPPEIIDRRYDYMEQRWVCDNEETLARHAQFTETLGHHVAEQIVHGSRGYIESKVGLLAKLRAGGVDWPTIRGWMQDPLLKGLRVLGGVSESDYRAAEHFSDSEIQIRLRCRRKHRKAEKLSARRERVSRAFCTRKLPP